MKAPTFQQQKRTPSRRQHRAAVLLSLAVGGQAFVLDRRKEVWERHDDRRTTTPRTTTTTTTTSLLLSSSNNGVEEWSDFDDFVGDIGGIISGSSSSNRKSDDTISYADDAGSSSTDNSPSISNLLFTQRPGGRDLTGVQSRLFSLGQDLVVTDFVGNMGFEEVVDWQYYYENTDDPADRKVVQPSPFDESKPKRTRTSSGSVVRVFRGQWVGRLGGTVQSRGLDRRVLVKEYTGRLALELARREQSALARLQSNLVADDDDAVGGGWVQAAASRTALARRDDANVAQLLQRLNKAPFLGTLGEVNLAELDGDVDPNDFYRALGVPPPKPEAIWIVYEYAGLNTVASYASSPPRIRRAQQPPKRNFFGGIVEPPPLPSFSDRAGYVVRGVMRGAIEALAAVHEAGLAHRSVGRSSIVMTTPTQDKREATSVYSTRVAALNVKLSDFGFSGLLEESCDDEEFLSRARAFGLSFRRGETGLAAANFAMSEDLHALGFVFLGLLMVTLAELPTADTPMPATDEDTLQKLLSEIFANDFQAFREYVEAEDVWTNLVELLDEKDGAGWTVLETLFTAREKTAENKNSLNVITARGLLSNPFFGN